MKDFSKKNAEDQKLGTRIDTLSNKEITDALSYSDLLKREKDQSALLSISQGLSVTRNINDLLLFVSQKLKPVFNFDYSVVTLYSKDLLKVSHISSTNSEEQKANREYQNLFSNANLVTGTPYELFIKNQSPTFYTIDFYRKDYPNHDGVKILQQLGIIENVIMTLNYDGKVLGTFEFHYCKPGVLSEEQTSLFSNLSNLVAIAVANILANEEILERDREKSLLLSLSYDFATIADRSDLFKIINSKVLPLFNCKDLVIFIANFAKDSYYLLSYSEESRKLNSNFAPLISKNLTLSGSVEEWILSKGEVAIIPFDEFEENFPEEPGIKLMREVGLKDSLVGALTNANTIIGSLHLHAEHSGHFSQRQLPLFKSICNQIAVAVANILANEEILEREKQKDTLFKVSNAIAKINNRQQLFDTIIHTIKPVFSCSETAVFIIDKDRKYYRMWYDSLSIAYDEGDRSKDGEPIPMNDNPVADDVFLKPVHILNKEQMLKAAANSPSIIKWTQESATEETLVCPLIVGGLVIGCFNNHSAIKGTFNEGKFYLYQSIADQLAVAIANIIANEEILEREKEKALLLSLSEDIAAIRNKIDLWKVMMGKVKSILPFNESPHVAVLNADGKTMRIVLIDPSKAVEDNESYRANANRSFEYINQPFELAIQAESPKIYSIDFFLEQYPDYWGTKLWQDTGIKELLVVQLKHGGKVIGAFLVHSTKSGVFLPAHFNLFKSVADQLATAVANILANEEILEREKEKSSLLSISEELATIRNKKDLFSIIFSKLKPIFNFDDAVIVKYSSDQKFTEHLVATETDQHLKLEGYKIITSQKVRVENTPYEEVLQFKEPRIIDLSEWIIKYPDHIGIKVALDLGIKESVFMPLIYGNILIGNLEFHSYEAGRFSLMQMPLYQNLSNQIATAFSNIIANEEILEREREKTVLLKISNQLSLVNDRKELWALVSKTLKEIIQFDVGVVATIDPDGKSFRILLSTAPKDMNNNPEYKELGAKPELLAGSPFEYIFKKEGVFQFSLTELETLYPGYLGLKMMREYGLLQTVGIKLSKGNELIGQAYFHFNKIEDIDITKFGLLKSIGEQLSIVVANILANEKIQEREREKSLQVEVVNAITSTKNKTKAFLNLANVINKVIPFHTFSIAFPFDIHYLIGFKKNKRGKLVEWHNVQEIMEYAKIGEEEYQKMLNEIAASGYFSKAHICVGNDHEDLCRKFKISALHHELIGTRSGLHLPFLFHGQNITVHIYLNSQDPYGFTEKDLSILQTMISPLSLAMENLFAFEDIEKREKEKTILLNLSNSINKIKDKQELWESIVSQLQPVFGFERDFTFLYLITNDREHYRFFLLNKTALANQSLAFKDVYLKDFPIKGAPYEQVINKDVWIFAIEDMISSYPNFKGFKLGLDSGQRQTAIVRLEDGGEIIGSLHLNAKQVDCFNETHIPFLKAIGKQVSIAIANILANEEIIERTKEKEKLLTEIRQLNNQLQEQNAYLIDEVESNYNFEEIVGQSSSLKEVFKKISVVGATDTTVLIMGDTGTGKELFARAIHNLSSRKNKPLIKLNCAALPPQLVESELFGHERGAFTGALDRRIGKFEIADGSTLFLDEIGELPLELQAKLLRAIQEKEIERLGSNKVIRVNVRIIAATNRNLANEVQAGKFRSDLYFRLDTFPIILPALRDRKDDIPLLAAHFIDKCCKRLGKKIEGISKRAIQELIAYTWPGNIRELEHIIERSVLLCKNRLINEFNLPVKQLASISNSIEDFRIKTWEENERDFLLAVLKRCGGRVRGTGGAAELLNLPPTTLDGKIRKLGLKKGFAV